MGVSIYVMGGGEGGYSEGVDFAYSGLQRLRQMAIIATISYLEEKIQSLTQPSQPSKKAKIETNPSNENASDENNESESSEKNESDSDDEDNTSFQLTRILESIKTWTTTQKARPLHYDSTQNSIFDLLGQFKQMMPIDYNNVNANYNDEYFARHNLIGLWKFVNHSDCDGVHSYGDCVDIHELFTQIIPHLKETEDNCELFKSVANVFEMAVESKNGIRYS